MKFLRKYLHNHVRQGLAQNRLHGGRRKSSSVSIVGLLLLTAVGFGALVGLQRSRSLETDFLTTTTLEDSQSDSLPQSALRPSTDNKPQLSVPQVNRRAKAVTKNNVIVVAFNASSEEQGFSTVDCQIDEYHGVEEAAAANGSERPVVLRGVWEPPNEDWLTEKGFLRRYGDVPYYIKDNFVQVKNDQCIAPFRDLWDYIKSPGNAQLKRSMLSFTNDKENPALFGELNYDVPDPVKHIDSFAIVSTMTKGQSHEFHRHGESWIGQAAGHKVWFFLPSHHKPPKKINACDYLTGKASPPKGTKTCLQSPGDVIWFPKDEFHATCSLTEWNVALGKQLGPRINQNFKTLPLRVEEKDQKDIQETLSKCSGESTGTQAGKEQSSKASTKDASAATESDWKWYDGNLGKYYDDLEKDHKRNPQNINDYAVHRWLGEKRSTQVHYHLIQESILKHANKEDKKQMSLLDAGCGLGSGLMWMEKQQPSWKLEGRTLSEEQANFINNKLPQHGFQIQLNSYDTLDTGVVYDAIYSIEAAIHSTDMKKTLSVWSEHLDPEHGVVVLIDDFLQPGANKKDTDVDLFARSWLANSLFTVTELNQMARQVGLELVESRDLLAQYRVVELNYKNEVPSLDPSKNRNHQGWMGSKYRQKLTVEGKLGYNLLVFRKMAKAAK